MAIQFLCKPDRVAARGRSRTYLESPDYRTLARIFQDQRSFQRSINMTADAVLLIVSDDFLKRAQSKLSAEWPMMKSEQMR